MRRGEFWWGDLGKPRGSAPGFERPCLIISANDFNITGISTVIVATLTSKLKYAALPGNFLVLAKHTGLGGPSVVNLTQLATVDKRFLLRKIGQLPDVLLPELEASLQLVLGLTRHDH